MQSQNIVSGEGEVVYYNEHKEIQTSKQLASFSDDVGCTVYEIANTVEKLSCDEKENIWSKLMEGKSELTSFIEIYTVTMALIAVTLKTKNNLDKPPQHAIKALAVQLSIKLPKNSNYEHILPKDEYVNNIHNILYNIHYEMMRTDSYLEKKTDIHLELESPKLEKSGASSKESGKKLSIFKKWSSYIAKWTCRFLACLGICGTVVIVIFVILIIYYMNKFDSKGPD
eukprot:396625_1